MRGSSKRKVRERRWRRKRWQKLLRLTAKSMRMKMRRKIKINKINDLNDK